MSTHTFFQIQKAAFITIALVLCAVFFPSHASAAVQTWNLRSSPVDAVAAGDSNCWAKGVWAAEAPDGLGGHGIFSNVSCKGNAMVSRDGVTWIPASNVPFNSWISEAWSPELGLFVVVGNDGTDHIMTSPDGLVWTMHNGGVTGFWLHVTWAATAPNGLGGSGLFVAVGYPGAAAQVMTSRDGINWTARTAASADHWNAVVWGSTTPNGSGGSGLFVAIAQSGTDEVMTSPDGITWTSRDDASGVTDTTWNALTWGSTAPNGSGGSGLFVAMNSGSAGPTIITSPDGVTWTTRTALFNDWYNAVWSPELSLFVVVGFSNGTGQEVLTSPDGVTWTPRTNAFDNNYSTNYIGLNWSPELGIFLSFSYTSNVTITSTDGITWTGHALTNYPTYADSGTWIGTAWSPELGIFVSVSLTATNNRVMTSSDGINWTSHLTGVNNGWGAVAWSPSLGLFAAVGASGGVGNRVMTSPDGITWTARASAADVNWQSVVWSPERSLFVAVAASGPASTEVMTSPDGITWTSRTAATASGWTVVAWSPDLGLFAAVAASGAGNRVMTSPDGITWTSRAAATNTNQWNALAWSHELGLFAAVAVSGGGATTANQVMTSPDGITWTSRTSSMDIYWQSVAWSPEQGLFTAVGYELTYVNPTISHYVMTSPDGINWTAQNDALNNDWSYIVWSPELHIFVAVAVSSDTNLSSPNVGNHVMTTALLVPPTPVISSVVATPGQTTATVTWTTDLSSDSTVEYGLTSGYGSSTTNATLTLSHSISLSSLTCATTYNYRVLSAASGQTGHSSNTTFTTTACPVTPTPTPTARNHANVINVEPKGMAGRPLGFSVLSHFGVVATLRLEADPLTVKGYLVGLSPNLDDSHGILPYAPGATYVLPDNKEHTMYLRYYSTSGALSEVFSRSTKATGIFSSHSVAFTRMLKVGMTGEDVRSLQAFLNSYGFPVAPDGAPGSLGHETLNYRAGTAMAVTKFQEAHAGAILTPNGLNAGTGIFGPATLRFVNAGIF